MPAQSLTDPDFQTSLTTSTTAVSNLMHYPRVVQYITLFPHDYGIHPVWK